MVHFFLLLFISLAVTAETIHFDHKSGFVYGVGLTRTSYNFPVRFDGNTKKVDESNTLIGPVFNLGYDILPTSFILLGIRGETYFADTMNMGSENKKGISNSMKGKVSALNITGRIGVPLKIKMKNLLDETNFMTGEIFFESGVGKHWADMKIDYSKKEAVKESYEDRSQDQRLTGILAAGFNLANLNGTYIELRVMQTRTISNKTDLKGSQSVNGGTETDLESIQKKNSNQDAINSVLITFGRHY